MNAVKNLITRLLGIKVEEMVKWLVVLVSVIAFLVFFALAPFHALMLCGTLIILASLYFKIGPKLAKVALYLGIVLIGVGAAAVIIPGVLAQLRTFASVLRELLIGSP